MKFRRVRRSSTTALRIVRYDTHLTRLTHFILFLPLWHPEFPSWSILAPCLSGPGGLGSPLPQAIPLVLSHVIPRHVSSSRKQGHEGPRSSVFQQDNTYLCSPDTERKGYGPMSHHSHEEQGCARPSAILSNSARPSRGREEVYSPQTRDEARRYAVYIAKCHLSYQLT